MTRRRSLFVARLFPLLLASLLVRPLVAQSAADSAAERLARGKQLFEGKGLCFSCHGKNGEGVLAPETRLAGRPFTDTKEILSNVVTLIKAGVDSVHSASGKTMPPRGGSRLTDAEVDLVAAYVLELRKRIPPK